MIIGILISRKWHKWRDSFIPFLFFVLFNLYYNFLGHSTGRWLWELRKPIVNEFLSETVYSFIIFPCWTILFLSFYPTHRRSWYYGKWIITSVLIEFFAKEMGYFHYTNGWNIGWTFFFYLTMYPVLRLAQVRQGQAIVASFILIIFYLWVFDYFPILFEASGVNN